MSEQAGRFGWVVKVSRAAAWASTIVLGLGVIACAGVLVSVIQVPAKWAEWTGHAEMPASVFEMMAISRLVLAVFGAAVVAAWVWVLQGLVCAWVSAEDAARTAAQRIRTVETLLEDQAAAGHRLVDLFSLSEQAKSLIYRDRELEAFRETVQADLTRQDYAAAVEHIAAIEKRFGYAEEAARLRKDLEDSRKATLEEKLDQAIRRLAGILEQHDCAQREAQRIMQIFPNHPKVASLPRRIEEAREQTKRSLLKQYKEALDKKDVEGGIRLLKELDRYLSPQEAAAWAESARGVFHAKVLNLRVQFSMHVAEQRWPEALATGEEIIREFPNSLMAQEVREKLDLLRQRATGVQQPAK